MSTMEKMQANANRSRTNTASSIRSADSRGRSISPPQASRNRSRLDSKDIPRTYSGLYGTGGELTHETPTSDLLPFELSRNVNIDWLIPRMRRRRTRSRGGIIHSSSSSHHRGNANGNGTNMDGDSPKDGRKGRIRPATVPSSNGKSLLCIYIFFILFIQFTVMLLPIPNTTFTMNMPLCSQSQISFTYSISSSFTITNIIHGLLTTLFLHWIKGSPNFYEQGEMNAMTTWEQLNCLPDQDDGYYDENDGYQNTYEYSYRELIHMTKKVLVVVPTVLCYIACHASNYDWGLCAVNLVVWAVCVVAKLEGMNGVRIWGINRTIGIDDDMRKVD